MDVDDIPGVITQNDQRRSWEAGDGRSKRSRTNLAPDDVGGAAPYIVVSGNVVIDQDPPRCRRFDHRKLVVTGIVVDLQRTAQYRPEWRGH